MRSIQDLSSEEKKEEIRICKERFERRYKGKAIEYIEVKHIPDQYSTRCDTYKVTARVNSVTVARIIAGTTSCWRWWVDKLIKRNVVSESSVVAVAFFFSIRTRADDDVNVAVGGDDELLLLLMMNYWCWCCPFRGRFVWTVLHSYQKRRFRLDETSSRQIELFGGTRQQHLSTPQNG